MRRTIVVATLAAFAGFCFASASSYASLRYKTWKNSDESFRLGYVIGYIDAAALAQRKDMRLQVPTGGGKNFDRWVNDVNAFYENPANASRDVPDAIYEIGSRIRAQMLREWGQKRLARPVPSPSPAP
jgi:hypothetical protein